MSNLFVTSDSHFHHGGIIRHCNRPFKDSVEMDEVMIHNWNAVVKPNDLVWHLGDFCWSGVDPEIYSRRLQGKIHYIFGNHDKPVRRKPQIFQSVQEYAEISFKGQKIILCHYPLESWNHQHRDSWMLHGHCHGSLRSSRSDTQLRLDLGVDCTNFYPLSFDDISRKMAGKKFQPVDHHGTH